MEKIIPFTFAPKPSATRFEDVVEPHMAYLYRLAYRFTWRKADAEDLVQEVLIKVYAQWQKLARMEKQRAWLARVTYNTYVDYCRSHNRSPLSRGVAVAEEGDGEAVALISQTDTAAEAANGSTRAALEKALAQLSPAQRALIALHDIEGYTLNELERTLDAPLGTLKSRLHRARAQLRSILDSMEPFDGF